MDGRDDAAADASASGQLQALVAVTHAVVVVLVSLSELPPWRMVIASAVASLACLGGLAGLLLRHQGAPSRLGPGLALLALAPPAAAIGGLTHGAVLALGLLLGVLHGWSRRRSRLTRALAIGGALLPTVLAIAAVEPIGLHRLPDLVVVILVAAALVAIAPSSLPDFHGTSASPSSPPADRVLGDYRLGAVIGEGGMATVHEAIHEPTGKAVAVKVLKSEHAASKDLLHRFLREARVVATIPSEYVATVLEAGLTTDGTAYIAMERLVGHDLAWHLRRRRRLSLDTALIMVEHAARALDAVHGAGVIHRDLKPSNIFLVDGLPHVWKVLDFGVSKLLTADVQMTRGAIGTPQYMAPEQVIPGPVDARADVYALTALAYRVLTGHAPIPSTTPRLALRDTLLRVPDDPLRLAPELPKDLVYVFAMGLAKRPARRFASVLELATSFRQAVAGELPEDIRVAGKACLQDYPWGKELTPTQSLLDDATNLDFLKPLAG